MTLLPMENKETILSALKCFEQEKPATIPPILEDYIKQISKNGQTIIPFTIQRICELFDDPLRHYKRLDKFLRGLEKVCMVVSTVDPQGNKIHKEDPRLPSRAGLDDCSLILNGSLNSSPTSPLHDNLQLPRAPKSSDDEVTEEEDDLEDDEKDNSSDGSDERHSSLSPQGNCPQNLSDNSSPTTAWPFKTQAGGSPTSTPPSIHFRSPPVSKTLASPSSLLTRVSSPTSTIPIPGSSDSVPPIMQVLRPIGQLEAFVQNMGSEVACCPTVGFNTTTAASGSPKLDNPNICLSPTALTSPLFSPTTDNEVEQSNVSPCPPTTTLSPTVAGVRRPHSPTYEMTDNQADDFTSDPADLEQSPAKRRRLATLDSSPSALPKEGMGEVNTLPLISPPSALMDSPPVILCNPLNRTYDNDSGEVGSEQSFDEQPPICNMGILANDPTEPLLVLENSPNVEPTAEPHVIHPDDTDQESVVETSSSTSITSTGETDSDTDKEEEEEEKV